MQEKEKDLEVAFDCMTRDKIINTESFKHSQTQVDQVHAALRADPMLSIEEACEKAGVGYSSYSNAKYRLKFPVKSYDIIARARAKSGRNKPGPKKKSQAQLIQIPATPTAEPVAPPPSAPVTNPTEEVEVLVLKGKSADIARILAGRFGNGK